MNSISQTVMSDDGIVRADGEFLQGHFEEAKELYAHALDQLEAAYPEQHLELAACLQKLGDTNYVLDRFAEAEQIFARLLTVLEQNDGPVQDIVTTILKLAKNREKLERIDEAKEMYERAASLGESSLASGHFLLSSIFTSYAAMLSRTGSDKERLTAIEEKVKQYSRKSADKAEPSDESKSEENAGQEAAAQEEDEEERLRKSKEEEIDAMRSKLRKAASKRESGDTGNQGKKRAKLKLQVPDATTADAAAPSESTETAGSEQTGKWLKKGKISKAVKGEGDRAKNRSKLRKSMLKGGPSAPPPAEPGEPGNEPPQESFEPTDQAQATVTNQLSETARKFIGGSKKAKQGPYVPPGQDIPLTKEEPKKRGLKLGQTTAPRAVDFDSLGRMTRSSDAMDMPRLRVEETPAAPAPAPAPAPAAASKFTAKQEKSEESEEIATLVPKLKETGSKAEESISALPPLDPKRFIVPAAVALLVCGWAIFMLFTLRTQNTAESKWFSQYSFKSFTSADGRKAVSFTDGKAELDAAGSKETVPVRVWDGNIKDEFDFVTGGLSGATWVMEVPEGLVDENGIVLYNSDAPENRVVTFMKAILRAAEKFYLDNGRYPQYATELTPNDTYKNPVSSEMESPQMCSSVGKDIIHTDAKTEFETKLESGGNFTDEKKPQPGTIRTFGVLSNPEFNADTNTYKWSNQSFFVHGYDRSGNLIRGGEKGKTMLMVLKNGRDVTSNLLPKWFDSASGAKSICLARVQKPTAYNVLFKYIMTLVALVVGIGGYKLYTSRVLKGN